MIRCRTPEFRERYKIDNGIYVLRNKRKLPRTVKPRDIYLGNQKIFFALFGRKIEEVIYLMGNMKNKESSNTLKKA